MNKKPAPKKSTKKQPSSPPSPPKVTSMEAWGKKLDETSIVQLPSGVVIKIKTQMGLVDFAMAGQIPLPLVKSVMEAGEELTKGVDSWVDIEPEKMKSMRLMLERIASVAVLEPKVVLDPKKKGISAEKISMQDLLSIFGAVAGRGTSLNLFRSFRRG